MQTEDRIRRFDDVFRTLLIVGVILFSFSMSFQKEKLEQSFFIGYVVIFVSAIVVWCCGKFYSRIETGSKVLGWFFLVMLLSLGYLRIVFSYGVIPLQWSIFVIAFSYALSYWLFWYLTPNDTFSQLALMFCTTIWLYFAFYVLPVSSEWIPLLSQTPPVFFVVATVFIVLNKLKVFSIRRNTRRNSSVADNSRRDLSSDRG